MKKRLSKSTLGSEKPVRRKRKYDEEFKQQALAMVRNGQTARSVAQALGIGENLIHRWKRASRTELPAGVVLFQRTVVLLSFYVLSLLIVKVSHRDDPVRDAI